MKEKTRILHIIKTLRLGGAEVNLLNLLAALDQDRYEVHVAYSFGGELESKFQNTGIRLFKYAKQDHKVKSPASVGIIARLVGYILSQDIDIIHTHNFSAHIWGSAAAKLTARKIVEHVHDFRYVSPQDFARRRGFNNQYKFIRNFRRVSDRVVVLTDQNRQFLIEQDLYPSERIREYQNGIPLGVQENIQQEEAKSQLIEQFGLRSDAAIILTPVRLSPEKNVDLILRIAPQVIEHVPNAVFLIAGDGPLGDQIGTQIINKGLQENVKMIGYCPEITRLLQATDVFLLPSFLELHSVAVLEAMSMQVAVVISKDTGCNNEFIDGENGILLDPFCDDGWAQALIRLLQIPSLRHHMAQKGFQTCLQRFNIKDVARKFEGLYDELTVI